MSVIPYQPTAEAPREWIALLPAAAELAKAVANTDFVPTGFQGNPAAITAAILYGDEVGLKPMQALAHIAVVEGRPTMSAEAMRALILQAGHELWVEDATTTRVTVAGRRRDSDQTSRVTWTMDDAKRANLDGKLNWRKYPRAMLTHRATAELARAIFADAIGGLAMTEEILDGAEPDEPSEEPATKSRRRRRATLAPVSSSPPANGEPGPVGDEATAESEPPHSVEGAEAGTDPAPSAVADTLAEESNERLRKRLMATYREKGFTEREPMLAFARFITGRPIDSRNDLTADEAIHIIDALTHGHTLETASDA